MNLTSVCTESCVPPLLSSTSMFTSAAHDGNGRENTSGSADGVAAGTRDRRTVALEAMEGHLELDVQPLLSAGWVHEGVVRRLDPAVEREFRAEEQHAHRRAAERHCAQGRGPHSARRRRRRKHRLRLRARKSTTSAIGGCEGQQVREPRWVCADRWSQRASGVECHPSIWSTRRTREAPTPWSGSAHGGPPYCQDQHIKPFIGNVEPAVLVPSLLSTWAVVAAPASPRFGSKSTSLTFFYWAQRRRVSWGAGAGLSRTRRLERLIQDSNPNQSSESKQSETQPTRVAPGGI